MSTYLRDVPNQVVIGQPFAAINLTGNTNGAVTDCANGTGRLTLVVTHGVINTTSSAVYQVKDSTDNTTFNSISGATLTFLNTATTNANTTQSVSFDRTARYIRVDATVTGSALGINSNALILQQKVQL